MEFYTGTDRTLGRLAENQARKLQDKPFILYKEARVTYAEFDALSNRIANGLAQFGVGRGDKVALLLDNSVDFLVTWFGIAKLGAVEVPINTELKGEMLRHALTNSDSVMVIAEAYYLDRLALIAPQIPNVRHVIVYPDLPAQHPLPPSLCAHGYSALRQGEAQQPGVQIKPSDLLAIMYTSGTTGPAKGVMLSHEYAFHFSEQKAIHMHSGPDDVIYNCYPMHNATGQFETTMTAMVVGGTVAHSDRFSANRFWEEIRRYGATEFVYMGGILSILFKRPAQAGDVENPVRAAYGCPTPRDIQREFERRFGLVLVEVYGSTEAGPVTFNPYDAPKVGSCGKPTSGYDVRIFDDDEGERGPGEIGEIVIRPGRPFTMFSGYYKMAAKTAEVTRNCWYHSGDLAYYDDEGYLFFIQRKTHAIRKKGYMISSWDIEQTANQHTSVLESAVVGLPEGLGEEEIKLAVVPIEGKTIAHEALWRFLCERLPYYMVPRYIEVKEAFSKTPTQRIEKYRLQEEGVRAATWDAQAEGLVAKRERHERAQGGAGAGREKQRE